MAESKSSKRARSSKVADEVISAADLAQAEEVAKDQAAGPAKAAFATIMPSCSFVLSEPGQFLSGCAFGIDQSVVLGTIEIRIAESFDLAAIEPLLEEFAIGQIEDTVIPAGATREAIVFHRIHAWHAAIQRGANVPVFGNCRVWERKRDDGEVRTLRFAVPSFSASATSAAMNFVGEAIAALAPDGADAERVLPALRTKFEAVLAVLGRAAMIGSNVNHFIKAARDLGIERRMVLGRIWVYGFGRHRKLLHSSISESESHLAVGAARDKMVCGYLLRAAGLPVAASARTVNVESALAAASQIGYPVVVKPSDADGGAGVTAGIEDEDDLRRAFAAASSVSPNVMVEKHQYGSDYRVTVLQGKAIKVLVRRPAGVVGDGRSTIAQLVDALARSSKSIDANRRKKRAPLMLDEEAETLLAARGYAADTIVAHDEFVPLRRRGNISAGGTYDVVPVGALHPDNRMLAEDAAAVLGLELAGIDLMSGDPATSWRETGGVVLEVNASPQIGVRGSENIFVEILSGIMGGDGRIPIHLNILQHGIKLPVPLRKLAAKMGCNAAAWGKTGWISTRGELGPFSDVLHASRGVLFNPHVTGALIAMTEHEVYQLGLPASRFDSIALVGMPDWQPPALLRQYIGGHSRRVLRRLLGKEQEAALA